MGLHNFKNTQVTVGGAIITGFADGTAIEAEKNESRWTQTVGADGNVTWNESNNETGTFTISLKPESSSLPHIRALYAAGTSFDVMLHDVETGVTVTGEDCRVETLPPFARAEEVEPVEVTILAAYYRES